MKKITGRIISFALCIIMIFSAAVTTVLAADLGELAAAFCAAVDAFADTTIIETTIEAVAHAESRLEEYTAAGGAVTDAAIAESYAEFTAVKADLEEQIEACNAFSEHVYLAVNAHAEGIYPDTRANLDLAAEYLPLIKIGDPYVSAAYADYMKITGELQQPEKLCAAFVEYATKAGAATTYAEADRYLKEARNAEKGLTLEGFAGEEEAYAAIERAEALMKTKKTEAIVFIAAVQKLKHDDLASFREAYAALEGVDTTTEGVENALDKLESYVKAYNKKVKEANAALADAVKVADAVM